LLDRAGGLATSAAASCKATEFFQLSGSREEVASAPRTIRQASPLRIGITYGASS
jgi:hypothetical protein